MWQRLSCLVLLFDLVKLVHLLGELVDGVLVFLAKGGELSLVLGLNVVHVSLQLLYVSLATPTQFRLILCR